MMKTNASALFLLLSGAVLTAPASVAAQGTPTSSASTEPSKVYTNVEQMPQLPTGGGSKALIEGIQRSILRTNPGVAKSAKGRVIVAFTIGADGLFKDGYIDTGIGSGPDGAVLAAINKMPRLLPGRQQGQRVPVQMRLPITFPILPPAPTPAP
ncbi:energy transducer TonB [Hymenobacter convexus]|uniref:energy transducer TonB n=1 Tax=Hymenobacter sp. CA1UV-4 TaxID=3063782 RepID=UPI002713D5AE|nr:energy transducer TonB [Hymenobacter sp. CA1UV-4]MDO7850896.1 energy transducer TonB [Hymenobacter sp. CA1UV-4]